MFSDVSHGQLNVMKEKKYLDPVLVWMHATIDRGIKVYLFLAQIVSEWRGSLTPHRKNRRKKAIFCVFMISRAVHLRPWGFSPVAVFIIFSESGFWEIVLSSRIEGSQRTKMVHRLSL